MLYEEILSAFQEESVKYVLVGGLAVNLLGSFRSTADLDILVEMDNKNLAKIVRILTSQGYKIKQPVDPMGIADAKTRRNWIKNKHMKALNFYKEDEFKEVDIIIDSPITFKEAVKTSSPFPYGRLTVTVASIDNIIKMKKEANRDIDKTDINELVRIKKVKGEQK